MSETVTGYIDHIIFRNEENGYTVMVVKNSENEEELTCVGSFPAVSQGTTIQASGIYTHHPVYGKQFQISSFVEKIPEDTYAMERYLGSGAIKGIGAALAARIVRRFGKDTLHIVEEEPERLAEVKGISEKKAREIAMQVAEKADMRKAMMFLQKYGISLNLGARIYQKYGETVYSVLQENPYRLADDISGIGFKIADEIAARIGIHADSDYRIRSGMLYTLLQASGEGHTYLPKDQLFARCTKLLGVDESYMEKHLMDMLLDRKLVMQEKKGEKIIYPSQYYYLELNTARMLCELNICCPEDENIVEKRIASIEKETGTVLDEMQKKAVTEAAGHGLFILTGGPGTGKTTIIKTIIDLYEEKNKKVVLAAPTGRAAKKMTEATDKEASTLHRLLGLGKLDDEGIYTRHSDYEGAPIDADVIVVDELSMVDMFVMNYLLKCIYQGTKLILVGDVDQLASVGPGSVLKDLINSEVINTVKLDKIFRQAAKSKIILNAHRVNNGQKFLSKEDKEIEEDTKEDFFFIQQNSTEKILQEVISLSTGRLEKFGNYDFFKNIQVLTPTKKGPLGTRELNKALQNVLNPNIDELPEKANGGAIFRVGDRIMQIKNNYDITWEKENNQKQEYNIGGYKIPQKPEIGTGVFNGEMGTILEIDEKEKVIKIQFDDEKIAWYGFTELEQIEHSYAITIHKAQRK